MPTKDNYNTTNKKVGVETDEILQKIRNGSMFNRKPVKITGPPRNRKSTAALKLAFSIGVSESRPIFVVSRTKKNAKTNYQTFRKHISSGTLDAIQYFGLNEICSKARGETPYLSHIENCDQQVIEKEEFYNFLDFNEAKWEIAENCGYCPKKVLNTIADCVEDNYIIFTTYSSIYNAIDKFPAGISESVIIMDEFRQANSLPVKKSFKIPAEGETSEETLYSWINMVQNYNYKILPKDLREPVKTEINRFLGKLPHRLTVSKSYDAYNKEFLESLKETTDFRTDIDYSEVFSALAGKTQKKDTKKILELLNLVKTLGEEDSKAVFELPEDSQGNIKDLALKIVEKDPQGGESREKIRKLAENSRKSFLVDSTPYPKKLDKFFYGDEIEYETIRLPKSYDFRFVTANTNYNQTNIKNQGEEHIITDLVKSTLEELYRNGKTACVFTRSKRESRILRESGLWDEILFHQRGVEQEGVSLNFDYVIVTGPPLQNFNTEKHRKSVIEEILSEPSSSKEERRGKIKTYYRWSAYMEMLQSAFRTQEGAILLNIDKADKESIQANWNWVQNFEWRSFNIKNQKKRKGKLLARNMMSEEIVTSEEIKETEIRRKIKSLLQIYPYLPKTKIQKQVDVGSAEVILEVRNEMIEEGILEVVSEDRTDWVSISY